KYLRPGENIALDAIVRCAAVALPVLRVLARPAGAATLQVEDCHLPVVAPLVAAHHEVERRLRTHAAPEEFEAELAVHRIGGRLMRDDREPALGRDGPAADGMGLRLHRHAELARRNIARDDREGAFGSEAVIEGHGTLRRYDKEKGEQNSLTHRTPPEMSRYRPLSCARP